MLNFEHPLTIISHSLITAVMAIGAGQSWADPACEPQSIAHATAKHFGRAWNHGSVRAWDETGDFFSVPFSGDLKSIPDKLKRLLATTCDVQIFDTNSLTIRILPRKNTGANIASSATPSSFSATENIISPAGTTLGVFKPGKDGIIVMMYPAKIAAAIARGRGTALRKDFKEIVAKFPAELDIEYNFGEFAVRTFGGTGTLSMRNAADTVFGDLRREGFQPAPGSEKNIAAFDGLFAPDHHESFWLKKDSIARIELEKLKNGQVRLNIHEDKERSIRSK